MIDPKDIVGWGADADPARRPGIPRERDPRPEPGSIAPPPQRTDVAIFTQGHPDKARPPVVGTAQPPRGASGAVRALAYRYPDHWTRHWLLLLLADRVDVWESRARRLTGAATAATVLALGAVAIAAMMRRA